MSYGSVAPMPVALATLFDVPHVVGSFLVSGAGTVAARALPEVVDDQTLAEAGDRVVRMAETLQAVGLDPDLCVLRFAEHKLFVKPLPGGMLCIVTGADIALPALRMAANLVARRVGPELVRLGTLQAPGISPVSSAIGRAGVGAGGPLAEPQGVTTRAGAAAEPAGSAQTTATGGTRMYRGRPIG